MIVELHNKLGQPQRIEATRVVVRDPIDGVISMSVEVSPRHYYTVHRGDGDDVMNRALAAMGIDVTVISDHVDMSQFEKPPGNLMSSPGDDNA